MVERRAWLIEMAFGLFGLWISMFGPLFFYAANFAAQKGKNLIKSVQGHCQCSFVRRAPFTLSMKNA